MFGGEKMEKEKIENRVRVIGKKYKNSDKPTRIKVGILMDWERKIRNESSDKIYKKK